MLPLPLLLCAAQGALDPADLFDLSKLPDPRPWKVRQFSSFDPGGGNDDAGRFLGVDGDRAILARVEGSGVVLRIWSANPDGDEKAPARFRFAEREGRAFEAPFGRLFDGLVSPFAPPLATRSSGGSISYLPMPFKDGLEVSVDRAGRCFYQVEAMTLAPGATASGWEPGGATFLDSIHRIEGILGRCGKEDPVGGPPSGYTANTAEPLAKSGEQFSREGAGRIEELHLEVGEGEDLRDLFLRVWVDGAREPAVDAPLDLFFCTPFGLRDTAALPLLVRGSVLRSFFRMPYSKGIRIGVAARGSARGDVLLRARVTDGDPGTPLRFHARFHRGTTVAGEPFPILQEAGRGHFVGVSMAMVGNDGIWFLEGDEEVFVDGEKVFNGTGTEDYFNCGWYFARGPVQQPFHGCTAKEDLRGEIGVHRFHVCDAIPFERSFRMTIEHGGRNDYPGAGYAAVAYAYLDRAEGAPAVSLEEDPRPLVTAPLPAGALDATALRDRLVSGKASVTPHRDGSVQRPFLDFESPERGEIGAVRCEVREAGIYRLWVAYRLGADATAGVDVRLDGRRLGTLRTAPDSTLWISEPFSAPPGTVHLSIEGRASAFGLRGIRFQNLLEGESHLPLPAGSVKDGLAVEQGISWDPARKGTSQVWFRNARVGSSFAIEVPVPSAGRYRIGGRFTRAPDYSIFRLLVD
ncbi:MAG TPA: glycoside hydrolase family 172 protein, partial [Planctomycetota bacterium]|nr:glycoside hydrolase family 172 protein [Planctomycetota bacterium]